MRFWEAGAATGRKSFGRSPRARRITVKERSLSIGVCQACGAKVEASKTSCVPCAIDYADQDASYFDRRLMIAVFLTGIFTISILYYLVLKHFNTTD